MKRDNRLCRLGSEVERFLGKEEVPGSTPGGGFKYHKPIFIQLQAATQFYLKMKVDRSGYSCTPA